MIPVITDPEGSWTENRIHLVEQLMLRHPFTRLPREWLGHQKRLP
jgi:hypothetical protein